MSGFHADPAALDALARRLEDTAEDYATAAAELETATAGDIGPAPVSAALAALAGEWSGRMRAVETDFTEAAAGVHTAARAYRTTDTAAAEELGGPHG